MAIWKSARRKARLTEAYFLPGGVVKGEAPTVIGGLVFSALGLRISLVLRF